MKKAMVVRCPFCPPNVDKVKFAESKHFVAVYNIAPILPGHSLIVPKRHVSSVLHLSEGELCEMMLFSRRVIEILKVAFKAMAFDWTIQDGEAAGQTVPHFHLHLIPRRYNDLPQPGDWYPKLRESQVQIIDSEQRDKLSPQEMQQIIANLVEVVSQIDPALIPRS